MQNPHSLKRLSGLHLVILVLATGAAIAGCSLLQKVAKAADPEIKVRDISIKDLNLDGISFHVDSELVNHLPVALPPTSMKLDVLVNEKKLTSITTPPVAVPASSATPLPFDVGIRYSDLSGAVGSLAQVESFKLGLKGAMSFRVDVPGFPETISVPFSVERTVPSFMPELTVNSVKLRHPDLSTMLGSMFTKQVKLGLDVDLTVKNRGGARFGIREMGYSVTIEGKNLFNGSTTSTTSSADGRSTSLRISTEIAVQDSIQSLISALQKQSIPYEFKGSFGFEFPGVDFKRIQLPLNKAGSISL